MNVGKSGKFQEYFIKIPGVFQERDKSFSRSFQGTIHSRDGKKTDNGVTIS
jgi:hypothetical protein